MKTMPNKGGFNGVIGKDQEGGFPQGSGGQCLCPNCGHREPNQLAIPCYSRKCPKCGAPMSQA